MDVDDIPIITVVALHMANGQNAAIEQNTMRYLAQ
jgi:hypothetical protein